MSERTIIAFETYGATCFSTLDFLDDVGGNSVAAPGETPEKCLSILNAVDRAV